MADNGKSVCSVSFRNAPLIEIVAELRWQSIPLPLSGTPSPGTPAPALIVGTTQLEDFFNRFGNGVYKQGFPRIERLIPPGVALPQGQAMVRFKREPSEPSNVMYQLGAGMFSANATPPYRSWADFAPVVEEGVKVLLGALDRNGSNTAFQPLILRYIDAFGSNLTGGRDVLRFLAEVFKLSISLPPAISRYMPHGGIYKPLLIVSMPVAEGVLQLTVGDAVVNGQASVLLDTSFLCNLPVAPEAGAVMAKFNSARAMIHDMFVDLTKPIQSLLQPE